MHRLYKDGFSLVDHVRVVMAQLDYMMEPGDRVLAMGCGAGGLVYEFRDLGFDGWGFDIHDRVTYRDPADKRFFGFTEDVGRTTADTTVDPNSYVMPFPDDSFDLIVSTSVMEHVLDLSAFMREAHRVLKPGCIGLHFYPSKGMLVEPHIYVPLATRIQHKWWFDLWAALGVRNEWEEGMPAKQVAKINHEYSQTGISYLNWKEIFEKTGNYFWEVRDETRKFRYKDDLKSNLRAKWQALKQPKPLRAYSLTQRSSLLYTRKKDAA
ncbi:hypothetical protein BH09PSE2_BH09PSE2_21020 [soil metagenome]